VTDHQPTARAVIFLRARHRGPSGSDRQAQARQLAAQRDTCRVAATHLGLVVLREYVEYGGTGPIWQRPRLRLLLEELRTLRDAAYVMVAHTDRLTRTLADHRAIELELEAAGARLIIADELPSARTHQKEVTA